MRVVEYEATVRTAGRHEVVDVTDDVVGAVRASGIEHGVACLFSPHTTCRFRFAEGGTAVADRLAPAAGLLPIRKGRLLDGSSRRILLVELDRERDRSWLLQIVGE